MIRYRGGGKRALGIVSSGFLLVVFLPVFVVMGVLVLVTLGQRAVFRQRRRGLGLPPFELLKFRTMRAMPRGGQFWMPSG